MNSSARRLAAGAAVVIAIAGLSGCVTNSSTKARPLTGADTAQKTLSDCRHITVAPFSVPSGGKVAVSVGERFAGDVQSRLRSDYGPIFESVESGSAARGLEGECLVSGRITKYKPGSRVARAILIGLGAASLEGEVTVRDAAGSQTLLTAPFDKLWAWGGIVGASKGIDEMSTEAAASIANTLARARGWEPPAGK
jgi:hypothetical protein